MNLTSYARTQANTLSRKAMSEKLFCNTAALAALPLETLDPSPASHGRAEHRSSVALRKAFHSPTMNHLLAALPAADLARLSPHLELVSMPQDHTLYEAGECPRHVYFPTTSVTALLCDLNDGALAEIALVGNEGMLGIPLMMGGETTPNRTSVQIEGYGYRMTGPALKREFDRGGQLQQLLLRYTLSLFPQMAQIAACNRHHKIEQQVCRLLLSCLDRVPLATMPVTHELLANLLGVRREAVSKSAGHLQRAGLIRYVRGHITVVDRAGLEKAACECYAAIKSNFSPLKSMVHRDNAFCDKGRFQAVA